MLPPRAAAACGWRGLGSRLSQHSLAEACRLGYRMRRFNQVLSTNHAGLACCQAKGVPIAGTLPETFLLPRHSAVDARAPRAAAERAPGRSG